MNIADICANIDIWLNDFLIGLGILAPILASLLIVVEGILAFLPLFVFVTVNVITLGPIFGGAISWVCTVIGSFFAFTIFRKGLSGFFNKYINKGAVNKFMRLIDRLKFSQIVFIISIPFAPSFFINVGAGLSHINAKKYLYALLIGKVITVFYSAVLGTSVLDSLKNPYSLIRVVIMITAAYIFSNILTKKYNLDERF